MDIKVAFIDLQVILYCMTFTIYKKVRILFLKHNPGDSPKKKEKKRKKGFGHLNWAYCVRMNCYVCHKVSAHEWYIILG